MATKREQQETATPEHSNTVKDPQQWTTGDEPMTGAQRSYLQTLSDEAGEPMDETLSKAEASQRIEELRGKHGTVESRTHADDADASNTVKDPATWVTGDEPMTGAQRSYLQTLSDEAGEPLDETLSKAEASRRIDELQQRTGRGRS
jgi:hypothetical protein